MQERVKKVLNILCERYPILAGQAEAIAKAFALVCDSFKTGGRLYLCGNGGSAADCEHIAGELLKSFKKARPLPAAYADKLKADGVDGETLCAYLESGLPTISLCGHTAFATAYMNDKNPDFVFAQQVNVWGQAGDVLLALSTSGNSKNCIYAAKVAKAKDMHVVFLGGGTGGKLREIADVSILAPETETFKVQELHLPIYHCLCSMLEEEFF
ncbi:MAG: SIS domain-containing protein [Clostridia bacterium]|nr:SIS domain-containing protein [Clostridia bacterium]